MNPNALKAFNSQVVQTQTLVANIIELVVSRPDGFNWQAGDYLWLGLDDASLKPFSIANVLSEDTQTIHCDIALTDGLTQWWQLLTQANHCLIKGPVSQYHWPSGDAPMVMLAGGTGITPLLAVLMAHEAQLTNRSVTLYWGVRREQLLYAQDELNRLMQTYPNFHWQAIVSEEDELWTGAKGNLPDVIMQTMSQVTNYEWLICGPWPMVKMLKTWLSDQSVNAEHIQ